MDRHSLYSYKLYSLDLISYIFKSTHGILEALIGKKKVSTKLVGTPTYLGPMGYELSRNEIISKGQF